jgi:spore maturation protein CgeE
MRIGIHKCFSELLENENIIRFYDNQLTDMYCNNYTYIYKVISAIELKRIIEDEIFLKLSEKSNFCNIYLNCVVSSSLLINHEYKPEISRMSIIHLIYLIFQTKSCIWLHNKEG